MTLYFVWPDILTKTSGCICHYVIAVGGTAAHNSLKSWRRRVWDIDAFGLNMCRYSFAANCFRADSFKPLSVMPNSGHPLTSTDILDDNETYLRTKWTIYQQGKIGGCLISRSLLDYGEISSETNMVQIPRITIKMRHHKRKCQESFAEKLVIIKVIAVGGHLLMPSTATFRSSSIFKEAGADAITIADSPLQSKTSDFMITTKILVKLNSNHTTLLAVTKYGWFKICFSRR
ncbi:MAG: hypothetical protein ACLR13_09955 [Acutalibacteraceae bacterium]